MKINKHHILYINSLPQLKITSMIREYSPMG